MRTVVIPIVATILGIIVLRELWCWLFKINTLIDLQRQILTQMQIANGAYLEDAAPLPGTRNDHIWTCVCGHINTYIPGEKQQYCGKCAAERDKVLSPHTVVQTV